MKRIDYERRLYFQRIRAKRERRKWKLRQRERLRRIARRRPNTLAAPMMFDIDDSRARAKLTAFLGRLRRTIGTGDGADVTIDFTDTRKMWASGTLLFKAELCRLRRIKNQKLRVRCIPPRNQKIAQVLKQTGIFKLFQHKSTVVPTYPDVVHWRYANGNEVDGAKYDEVLGKYDGTIPDTVASGLYLGLTEAMTNCHHHAYIAPRKDELNQSDEPKDWWMFSQEKEGRLSVVFCDLGVGIPETLPTKQPGLWQRLKTAIGVPTDADAIDEAIKESKTRTEKHYRGKGLKQLVDVIEKTPGAVLTLHSNHGRYTYRHGNSNKENYSDSILGTLIAWSVPVKTTESKYAKDY